MNFSILNLPKTVQCPKPLLRLYDVGSGEQVLRLIEVEKSLRFINQTGPKREILFDIDFIEIGTELEYVYCSYVMNDLMLGPKRPILGFGWIKPGLFFLFARDNWILR